MHEPHILDEEQGLICARVQTVRGVCDPLGVDLWRVGAITAGDIHAAQLSRAAGTEQAGGKPQDVSCRDHPGRLREHDPLLREACRACELSRLVDFAEAFASQADDPVASAHAMATDPHPITLDVGYGLFVPEWLLVDGNHRLAAAIATEVAWVPVAVIGDWDRGVALLVDEAPAAALS